MDTRRYGDYSEPEPEEAPNGEIDTLPKSRSCDEDLGADVSPSLKIDQQMTDAHISSRSEVCRRGFQCAGLAFGIIAALGGHGIFQERIMSVPYGGEYFKASAFLVLCNRLVAVVFAANVARFKGESLRCAAPVWKYILVSLGNVIAAMCQYEALKWVSFPVQLLGKSFKMIPVMIWGMIMNKKQFKVSDWLFSVAITAGVAEFMMAGSIAAPNAAKNDSVFGILLLCLFIAADSFTSTFQEKLFRDHKTTKYNQMIYVNSFSAAISYLGLLVSGDLGNVRQFCFRHPQVIADAIAISAASVTGQYFIVSMVKEFGALILAAAMNVRQLLSILISYRLYNHHMTLLQGFSLIVVFAAMFLKSLAAIHNKIGKAPSSLSEEARPAGTSTKVQPSVVTKASVVTKGISLPKVFGKGACAMNKLGDLDYNADLEAPDSKDVIAKDRREVEETPLWPSK